MHQKLKLNVLRLEKNRLSSSIFFIPLLCYGSPDQNPIGLNNSSKHYIDITLTFVYLELID